jgi:uronate dehydrogenase
MADIPPRPVLLTGASGALGRVLTRNLAKLGWTLRLTDIAPFPDPVPAGSSFTRADLVNGVDILRLAEGCGMILHFGGVSVERPFDEIIGPNLRGLYHIYEAARREGARVLFASSNHSIGFHERSVKLDADCQFLPDGYYGLSKAYGELMGRMYWYKHGVQSVHVRIGSCLPEPVDARMLSTYLSFDDLTSLCIEATLAPEAGCMVVWGASANARTYWGKDDRDRIGWAPTDSADPFAGQLGGKVSDSPIQEAYQGGAYTVIDNSRGVPAPGRLY